MFSLFLGLAVFCALLVFMLDYAFGGPGNEKWNDSELLSAWAFFLAKRRLQKDGAWQGKQSQLLESLATAKTEYDKKLIRKSFRQAVFSQAREVFYWEKAVGMCPICFHVWVTIIVFLVTYFYFPVNIYTFGFSFLLSHLLIRILKKIL